MNPNPYDEHGVDGVVDAAELARFEEETTAYLDTLETDPAAGRALKLTQASDIVMRPVVWLWTDRIPLGALTLIPGREGIGKSLLLCYLIAQITRGELPGVFFGTPKAVIYAASEDSWAQTIAPRLHAAGANLELVFRVEVEQDGMRDQLTLPMDTAAMTRTVQEYKVGLLAADPLLSLIDVSLDTHRDRELRLALEPLARLADQTGCAVVGLAHFNKSANTDALNLITGSRAFSAVARAVISIARDNDADDGSCVLSQSKNNLGRLDLPNLRYIVQSHEIETAEGTAYVGRLEITGESDRSVSDILADAARPGGGRGNERASKAAVWLARYLAQHGGQAPAKQAAEAAVAAGIAKRTLERALQEIGGTSERGGFPSTSMWRLPAPADKPSTDPTLPFEA